MGHKTRQAENLLYFSFSVVSVLIGELGPRREKGVVQTTSLTAGERDHCCFPRIRADFLAGATHSGFSLECVGGR